MDIDEEELGNIINVSIMFDWINISLNFSSWLSCPFKLKVLRKYNSDLEYYWNTVTKKKKINWYMPLWANLFGLPFTTTVCVNLLQWYY